MALMTLPEVRQNIETGLLDTALQRIMNAVEQDIDHEYGAVALQTDNILEGGLKSIWTSRPISSITSVTERDGTTDTILSSDDYELNHESQLDRLTTGTNSRSTWGNKVTVVYVPVDTTARRIAVYLRLIKLDIQYSGLDSERTGDFSSKSTDYPSERLRILSGLRRAGGMV